MPDSNNANLVIGVGLDLSQLRAQKGILEAEVRTINKDFKKATGEGDLVGATAAAGNLIAHERQLAAVSSQYRLANVEAKTFRDTLKEITEHSGKLREMFEAGGGMLSGGAGGILRAVGTAAMAHPLVALGAVATGGAAFALEQGIDYAHEITTSAAALGLSTGQMDDWVVAARRGFVEQELFVKSMEKFEIATEKAAAHQRELTYETNKLMAAEGALDAGVLRGGRGDKKDRKPTSHLVDASALNIGRPSHDDEMVEAASLGTNAALERVAKQNLGDIAAINLEKARHGEQLLPVLSLQQELARMKQIGGRDDKAGREMRDLERERGVPGVPSLSAEESLTAKQKADTAEPFSRLHIAVTGLAGETKGLKDVYHEYRIEFRKLNAEVANSFQRTLMGRAGISPELQAMQRNPANDAAFDSTRGDDPGIAAGYEVAHAKKGLIETGRRTMIEAGLKEAELLVSSAEKMKEWGESIKHGIEEALGPVINGMAGKFGEAGTAAGRLGEALNAAAKLGGSGAMLDQRADGGYISGPGSGTSDSIPARLSNGEFVINARATSRNYDLLHAINNGGYAMGGLVGFPAVPRFAEGGAVGRSPVNLHIGNNSYALHGNDGVVSELVAAASRENMTSTGVMPSWVGARASGR